MTKLSKKQMVERIQKLAIDYFPGTSPPTTETHGPAFGKVPTPPAAAPVATPKDVANMQSQLRALAEEVTQEIGAQNVGGAAPQQAQTEAWGRINFANFLTEHFVNDSDLAAVEFNPDPKAINMSQKQPTSAHRMNVVMDTMNRVGNPQTGEFAVDNIWGPRTNAALRNAYALAFGLLKVCQEFKIQPRYFGQQELTELKPLIPATSTEISPQEKQDRAKKITLLIKLIRGLFSEVKQQILQKPAYQSYIEGTQAYATYSNKSQGLMSPEMINRLNQVYAHITVNDGQKITPIFASDLASARAFRAWKDKNAIQMSDKDILGQVRKHISDTGFQPSVPNQSKPQAGAK